MIVIKERTRIDKASMVYQMLEQWQRESYNKPTDETDIKLFLAMNFEYKPTYKELLLKWNETRWIYRIVALGGVKQKFKREYLKEEQIKDWFEFYYQ